MAANLKEARATIKEKIATDTEYWAKEFAYIRTKSSKIERLVPSAGQIALEAEFRKQREAGLPERGVVLKARQIGISTWMQAKLLQMATQRPNIEASCLAHNRDTGGKLFRMAETMYSRLPEDPALNLKPDLIAHRRAHMLHFGNASSDQRFSGDVWPDSIYSVDVASESDAGRGSTLTAVHGSEIPRWRDVEEKMASLSAAIPDEPGTLFCLEATAHGFDLWKDICDDAREGRRAGWFFFFWGWQDQPNYRLGFANEAEKEKFSKDLGKGPYGEEEADLQKKFGCDLEQLHWRRHCISSTCNGKLETFWQEFPAYPDQAFISSGSKLFDQFTLNSILVERELAEPPIEGGMRATGYHTEEGRTGPVEVPDGAIWVDRGDLQHEPPWKVWTDRIAGWPDAIEGQFILAADISGGSEDPRKAAFDAIQIIDHRERLQVAEFRSHIDPDLLALEIYLACQIFNQPWAAPEVTGYGLPVVRKLLYDLHYPYLFYRRKSSGYGGNSGTEMRLGWQTTRTSKPQIESGFMTALRDGTHGLASPALIKELMSLEVDDQGRTEPPAGQFSDLAMAYLIAQQVAEESPFKGEQESSAVQGVDEYSHIYVGQSW